MFDSGNHICYIIYERYKTAEQAGGTDMNTQDDIMKTLWDNPNTQGIARMIQSVVLPAISKMPESQQIEAMGTVRDAVSDIAEYEECKKHMTETIKEMRKNCIPHSYSHWLPGSTSDK